MEACSHYIGLESTLWLTVISLVMLAFIVWLRQSLVSTLWN